MKREKLIYTTRNNIGRRADEHSLIATGDFPTLATTIPDPRTQYVEVEDFPEGDIEEGVSVQFDMYRAGGVIDEF